MGKKQKRVNKKIKEISQLTITNTTNTGNTSNVVLRNSDPILSQETLTETTKIGKNIEQFKLQDDYSTSNSTYNQQNPIISPNKSNSGQNIIARKYRSKSAPKAYGQNRSKEVSESNYLGAYLQRNANSTNYINQRLNAQLNPYEHDFSAHESFDDEEDDFYIQKRLNLQQYFSQESQQFMRPDDLDDNLILPNKPFAVDELSLDTILEKIYFGNYSFDDIKEYLFPALRNIKDLNAFFDILFNVIKDYANEVREHLVEKLKVVLVKSTAVSSKTQSYGHALQGYGSYKPFNKNAAAYNTLIEQFFESYRDVEILSDEAEKISTIYLENFIDKSKSIKFDCLELHNKMFMSFVYNDPYIKHFLESMYILYGDKPSIAQKYPAAAQCIKQLYEFLYLESDTDHSKILLYEEDVKRAGDENLSPSKTNKKETIETNINYEEHKNSRRASGQRNLRLESLEYLDDQEERMTSQERRQQKKARKKNRKKNKQNGQAGNANSEGVVSPNMMGTPEKKSKFIEETNGAVVLNKENQQAQANQAQATSSNAASNSSKKKAGFDREIEDFERRLLSIENVPAASKVKPNLSEDWIKSLKQTYQKKLNLVY